MNGLMLCTGMNHAMSYKVKDLYPGCIQNVSMSYTSRRRIVDGGLSLFSLLRGDYRGEIKRDY